MIKGLLPQFSVGDKVMQVQNNYVKEVYNGDVGQIVQLDEEEQCVTVHIDGRDIAYTMQECDELMLSYACSIHKFQGSECPCVVLPLHMGHYRMLYRHLLYTGMTRGKQVVVLVGSRRAISIAVQKADGIRRRTGLKGMLGSLS